MTNLNELFDDHANDVPQPLGRQLAKQIRRFDPTEQLDAVGCVLAKTLVERDRLREINAELLAALKNLRDAVGSSGWQNAEPTIGGREKRVAVLQAAQDAIARAEGEDRC